MDAKEMLCFKRTWQMEQLYLLLKNDSKVQKQYNGKIENYAKRMANGDNILIDNLARIMVSHLAKSCDRLICWYSHIITDPLNLTHEQKEIVSWQWFYNNLINTYNSIKN